MRSIFISSTFQDMQKERDLLQNYITPLINERIRRLHEEIHLIDLRWGVNTENLDNDEGTRKVLEVCFDEIEKCKPYMIILIGERYGWIPSLELIQETTDKYHLNIKDSVSVTEMEIQFGALIQDNMDNCIFCFREEINNNLLETYKEEDDLHKEKLRKLKEKILKKNPKHLIHYHIDYDHNELKISDNFQNEIIRIISEDIEKKYSDTKPLTWQENTLKNNEFTLNKYLKTFVSRTDLVNKFTNTILNTHDYLYIITGEKGSGKTAILSKLYHDFSKMNNMDTFIFIIENDDKSEHILDFFNQINYYLTNLLHIEYQEYSNIDEARNNYFHLMDLYNHTFDEKRQLLIFMDIPKVDYAYIDSSKNDFDKYTFAFPLKNQKIITTSREYNFMIYNYKELKMENLKEDEIEEIIKEIAKKNNKELSLDTIETIKKHSKNNPEIISLIVKRLILMNKNDYDEIRERGDGIQAINHYLMEMINKMPSTMIEMYEELVDTAIDQIRNDHLKYAVNLIALSKYGIKKSTLFAILKKINKNITQLDLSRLLYYLDHIFEDSILGRIKIINDVRKIYKDNKEAREDYYTFMSNLDNYEEIDIKEICNVIHDYSDFYVKYVEFYYKHPNLDSKRFIILDYLMKSLRIHDFDLENNFYMYCNSISNYLIDHHLNIEKMIVDLRNNSINNPSVIEKFLQILKSKIIERKEEISEANLIYYLKDINYTECNLNIYNNYNQEYILTFLKQNDTNKNALKELGIILFENFRNWNSTVRKENLVTLWEDIYQNEKTSTNKKKLIDVYKKVCNSYPIEDTYIERLKELEQTKKDYDEENIDNILALLEELEKSNYDEETIINLNMKAGEYYFNHKFIEQSLDHFNKAYYYAQIYDIKNGSEHTIRDVLQKTFKIEKIYLNPEENKRIFEKQLEIFDIDTKSSDIDIRIEAYQKFIDYLDYDEEILVRTEIINLVSPLKDQKKYHMIYINNALECANRFMDMEAEHKALKKFEELYHSLSSLFDIHKDIIEKYYLENVSIPNIDYLDYYLDTLCGYQKALEYFDDYEYDDIKKQLYKEYVLLYILKHHNDYDAGNIIFCNSNNFKYVEDIFYSLIEKLILKKEFYYSEKLLSYYNDSKLKEKLEKEKDNYLEEKLKKEIEMLKDDYLIDLLKKIYIIIPIYRIFTKELLAFLLSKKEDIDDIDDIKDEIKDVEIILDILTKTKKVLKENNVIYLNNDDNIYYKLEKENNNYFDLLDNNIDVIDPKYGYYDYHKHIDDIIDVITFIIDNQNVSGMVLRRKYNQLNMNKFLELFIKNDMLSRNIDHKYCFKIPFCFLENKDIFPNLNYHKEIAHFHLSKYRTLDRRIIKAHTKKEINKERDYISHLKLYFLEKKIIYPLKETFITYLKLREYCKRNNEPIIVVREIQKYLIKHENTDLNKIFYRLLVHDSFYDYLYMKEYDYPDNENLIFKFILEVKDKKIIHRNNLSSYDEKIKNIIKEFNKNIIDYIQDDIKKYINTYDHITLEDIKKNFMLSDIEIEKVKEIL